MASALKPITSAEFEVLYGECKPYFEFWEGEAIQKAMPTWIHGLVQSILLRLLFDADYKTASEIRFKIDPELQLIPDVVATKGPIQEVYPTRPVEIVVEILSEADPLSRTLAKCRAYQRWGIEQIYVIAPDTRISYRWIEHLLEEVDTVAGISCAQICVEEGLI